MNIYDFVLLIRVGSAQTFSKMKMIKNGICSVIAQQNLEVRILLESEYDILKQIDLTGASDNFIQQKVRKSFKND